MLKKILFILGLSLGAFAIVHAQDIAVMRKEAENFEKDLKEPEALDKYKQILAVDANNVTALVKAAELSCSIGGRQKDKNDKRLQYESAMAFAKRAIAADGYSADSYYAVAMVSGKMTEIETENKKLVAYVRGAKFYADKAIQINPNHAKANFTEGRWHYEMATLAGLKKAAAKVVYGGLPNATLDSAIYYLEKCKTLAPYFVLNYYYLNKAYKEDNRPTKQIEVLGRMVKLPTRSIDDIGMKADAAQQLQDLQ
ncbi:tetratricopeptide repeat protein [Parasediminibacterium sp. JCM 36343]|uniref:tetratricopeptide repeat protein n=1 Tax=Parasediminibacterium sp. JCM 36343 TaxID=3374279 RepID=UPI00397A411A